MFGEVLQGPGAIVACMAEAATMEPGAFQTRAFVVQAIWKIPSIRTESVVTGSRMINLQMTLLLHLVRWPVVFKASWPG
jgi:hypothetical protein